MNGLLRYLLGRAVQVVLTLLAVSLLTFILLHTLPGSLPLEMLGREATPARVRVLTRLLGVDLPLPLQYLRWIGLLLAPGELRQVTAIAVPTLELLALGGGVALMSSLSIASLQARLRGSLLDRALGIAAYVLYTLPSFWVGLMLVWIFADWFLLLPATGPLPAGQSAASWWLRMILPVLTLALATIASWSTLFRAAIEDALRSDYVRTARAKGLGEREVLRRHALRPAALPVITVVGMSLPTMFNNVVAIEIVFSMMGLGSGLVGAISGLQFGVAGYLVLVIAAVTAVGSLIADMLYALADPRIQFA